MKCYQNIFSIYSFLVLLLLSCSLQVAAEGDDLDLEAMTNEELEKLCTSRGFELVKEKDKESGETTTYSHDDYVNAAKQCLDIEGEMEEVLARNPELLDDIQEEAERMRRERDRLESELSELKDAVNEATSEEPEKQEEKVKASDSDSSGGDAKENESEEEVVEDKIDNNKDIDISDSDPEEVEEVIDLDAIEMESTTGKDEDVDGKTEETPPVSSQAPSSNNVTTPNLNEMQPMDLDGFIQAFKDQVKEDMEALASLIPKNVRVQFMTAIKPIVTIVKNSVMTAVNLVKRYTSEAKHFKPNEAVPKKNDSESEKVATTTAK